MLPEHQDWLKNIKQEAKTMRRVVQAEVSYEKLEQALFNFGELFNQMDQFPNKDETIWQEVDYHYKRLSRMLEVKAPRLILEYEMKWLVVLLGHIEQLLKGKPPRLTVEESQLRESDLYNL